jgi:head-tail adaptor
VTAPAGRRRHVVDVQQHNGQTIAGEPTYGRDEDWETIMACVPATYRGVTGGESVRGRQMEPHTTGLLEILSTERTRKINSQMRLLFQGRKLNIVSVLDPDGMQRDLWIQTSEVR